MQGMQTEQYLPYQSDYVIESRTRDITNPEHKSIVAGFMQRCCWIPEPTTILWIGNQITNGGFYNPQEFFEILKNELPQMLEMRTYFCIQHDSSATRSLTFFMLEMFASYQATRDILEIAAPTAIEQLFQEQFFAPH